MVISMVPNRKVQDLGRRCADFLASTVVFSKDVTSITAKGKRTQIPFATHTKPDIEHTFSFNLTLPKLLPGERILLIPSTTGSGLVYANTELISAVDSGHRIVFLPQKRSVSVHLVLTPRGMFGSNPHYLRIDGMHVVAVRWEKFCKALFLLNLFDCVASSSDAKIRDSVSKTIEDNLEGWKPDISLSQVIGSSWIANTLGIHIPSIERIMSDYSYLADLYSPGTERGHLTRKDEAELISRIAPAGDENTARDLVYFFGHAHIDVAWLWPFSETKRKVYKTFLNMIRLMQSGYDFRYAQSTSLYYEIFAEQSPELFSELKNFVREGRWVPVGGMYVESDTNIIPSEALARQFLYAQDYFEKEFGRRAEIGWLPDTFGFSAQLPQLMVKAGLKVFVTHKMMWNDTTDFPYHFFQWCGLDGTHIPTEISVLGYNISVQYYEVMQGLAKFKQRGQVPMICAYGLGDGGGGPNVPMLEWLKNINSVPGLEGSVSSPKEDDYLNMLLGQKQESVVSGELYLERHRGVYTTNTRMKKRVAELERLLRRVDFVNSLFSLKTGRPVGKDQVSRWKTVLLNCFHDLLPGSANTEAYHEAFSQLDEAYREAGYELDKKMLDISAEKAGFYAVLNTSQWVHQFSDLSGNTVEIPPLSLSFHKEQIRERLGSASIRDLGDFFEITAGKIRCNLGKLDGIISFNMVGEDCIIKSGNISKLYVDEPGEFDAWEISRETLSRKNEVPVIRTKVEWVGEKDNIPKFLVFREFEDGSEVEQIIEFLSDKGAIRIRNHLKVMKKLRLLKLFFMPKKIVNTLECSVPFGWVSRDLKDLQSTKFEVPCLNWLSYGDLNSRFALVSDHLHGYGIIDGMLGMTISKMPFFPDPSSGYADLDSEFYLIPLSGDHTSSEFNSLVDSLIEGPLIFAPAANHLDREKALEPLSMFELKTESVHLDSVAVSLDRKGIVLRLHESSGKASSCTLNAQLKSKLVETDLVERAGRTPLEYAFGEIIQFRAFEIKTLKVLLGE